MSRRHGAGGHLPEEHIMSKVVVTEFVSLDGVMEDPGGAEGYKHGGWTFKFDRAAEGDKFKLDELQAADAMLLGRVTYQGFAAAWPTVKDDAGFAEKMNSMRKYVVSSTLSDADATWDNTVVIRGDVVAEVAKLKNQPGGDLLVEGSALLARTLIEAGLVDEYRLMVFPIILGSGKRLFPDSMPDACRLTLTSSATTAGGVQMLTFEPAAADR
jgi:dihydrofolate reductase